MTEVAPNNPGKSDKQNPVLEHFVELRKYIEQSHDGLSKRLEKVEAGQQRLEAGQQRLEAGVQKLEAGVQRLENGFTVLDGGLSSTRGGLAGLERKVDAGFERLARKIDALTPGRRAAPRRRKP